MYILGSLFDSTTDNFLISQGNLKTLFYRASDDLLEENVVTSANIHFFIFLFY